jgi:predicted amidohydrolase
MMVIRLCVAQTRPIKGNIQSNIDNHKKLIDLAISNGADIVIFPELSLTGYEPTISKELATNQDDSRFDDFQRIKKYLHPDEEGFFIRGQSFTGLKVNKTNIALAICYELSVHEHSENAFKSGAEIYIASVAKFVNGVDKAINRLSDIDNKYSMTVLMSNCVGQSDGYECAGKTSIWNNKGILLGQLNDKNEGILIIDTDTQKLIEKQYKINCH